MSSSLSISDENGMKGGFSYYELNAVGVNCVTTKEQSYELIDGCFCKILRKLGVTS